MFFNVKIDELATERLRFRLLTPEDRPWVLAFVKDDTATRYYFPPDDREQYCQLWYDREQWRRENYGATMYVLEDKATGEPIGQCGILVQEVDNQLWTEVGYGLRPEYWHQGYAIEAATSCRDYIFRNNFSDLVISLIHPDNVPSQNVARRNGMTKGHRTTFRDLPIDMWRITRKEWEKLGH